MNNLQKISVQICECVKFFNKLIIYGTLTNFLMDMNQGIKYLNWKFSEFLSGINEVLKNTLKILATTDYWLLIHRNFIILLYPFPWCRRRIVVKIQDFYMQLFWILYSKAYIVRNIFPSDDSFTQVSKDACGPLFKYSFDLHCIWEVINLEHRSVHRFNVLCIVLGLTTNFAVFPAKQLVYTWTF